ncbi:MAG: bifunctional 4'-phosphopantothenoylcysteine decarboxylase/phosphopantothenoylcysteine synthetase, partial [Gammaproteobacteria bacterium]|nr:bifunctional 4'-phosphopantothenoylcysteine decarboxylase/phosphopantothenoylcysteine synthetase [Gammaproteobacteria bacterium]
GADVILISGPTNLSVPNNVKVVKVISAQEMYDAVFQNIKDVNIFIGAAAVANYHLENPATQKIKSSEKKITLSLIANPDIIHSVAALENKPFVVGFAAETNNLIESAQLKLVNKKLDMIIANDVSGNKGMGSEKNAVTVIDRLGKNIFLPENIKKALAKQMLAEIQDSVKNVVSR